MSITPDAVAPGDVSCPCGEYVLPVQVCLDLERPLIVICPNCARVLESFGEAT